MMSRTASDATYDGHAVPLLERLDVCALTDLGLDVLAFPGGTRTNEHPANAATTAQPN